jgi:hypothetical protein
VNELLGLIGATMPVVFGCLLGSVAKFGIEVQGDAPLRPRQMIGHVMTLGALAAIAHAAAELGDLAIELRVIAGVSAGLLGAKLVAQFEGWSFRQWLRRLLIDRGNISGEP